MACKFIAFDVKIEANPRSSRSSAFLCLPPRWGSLQCSPKVWLAPSLEDASGFLDQHPHRPFRR
jgi:hypothetical protein